MVIIPASNHSARENTKGLLMNFARTRAPRSSAATRSIRSALLFGSILVAANANAIPVQYTATVLTDGTYLSSPTATPVILAAATTKLVLTVETDAAVAAIPPSPSILESQVYPLRSAALEVSGVSHPLDLTKVGLISYRTAMLRVIALGAFNSTVAPSLPLPLPLPVLGTYVIVGVQGADPTVDPLPMTQPGTYLPLAQNQYPGTLPFTDGASVSFAGDPESGGPKLTFSPPTAPVLAWEVKLLPTTKAFSFFKPVATKNVPASLVAVAAGLTLAADTNGINPSTEAVTLAVGSYTITVPVGGFKKGKTAVWTYTTAKTAGVQRSVVLTQAGANTYVLAATLDDTTAGLAGVAKGAAADISLKIGDDVGTANVIVR